MSNPMRRLEAEAVAVPHSGQRMGVPTDGAAFCYFMH
jgi:hypothetical protein